MYKEPPFTPAAMGFTQKHMQFITSQGFNVVRFGFYWAAIEPKPGQYNNAYLAQMSNTLTELAQHNIHAIIDFHQDGYSSKHGGMGFPPWTALGTAKNINLGFPLNTLCGFTTAKGDTVGFNICQDWDAFWNNDTIPGLNEGAQDRFIKMLTYTTKYLTNRKHSNILGYELMNEPMVGSGWKKCQDAPSSFTFKKGCVTFDRDKLAPFIRRGIDAIRAQDPYAIVLYEPNGLHALGASSQIPKLNKDNISFSFHHYDYSNIKAPFQAAKIQSKQQNAAMFMTEFGANMMPLAMYNDFFKIAEKNQLSWTYWTLSLTPFIKFSDQAPFILLKDARQQGLIIDMNKAIRGDNLNQTVLNHLARPYPHIIAGTLINTSFSPGSAANYNLHYHAMVDQNSRIFVPKTFCPRGCHVDVQDEANNKLPAQQVTIKADGQFIDITLHSPQAMVLHVMIRPKTWWQQWFSSKG